ncbi:MAG: hypothetical protein ACRCYO_20390, partial [Bacteroidia bacterium]
DAFELVNPKGETEFKPPQSYFTKRSQEEYKILVSFCDGSGVDYFGYSGIRTKGITNETLFYGRSALRQVPFLRYNQRSDINATLSGDLDRPASYAARDFRLYNDLELIARRLLQAYQDHSEITSGEVRLQFLKPLNEAISRVFGNTEHISLQLSSLIPSGGGEGADVRFKKGESEYHYNMLSTGEKEVFNILLNFFVRQQNYQNTIYFIDELDVHLNTSLQKKLLKEVVENWIPDNCQLWTASHSLGFIEYANESNHAAIIDLDNLDFDKPQSIIPALKAGYEVFEIAIPSASLAALLSDKRIVFAERTNAKIYNTILLPDVVFVDAVDRNDVYFRTNTEPYEGLADRDFLTDAECVEIMEGKKRFLLLNYYCFENYLYHPENIAAYFSQKGETFDKQHYEKQITQEKNRLSIDIAYGLHRSRNSYPYFKAEEQQERRKEFEKNSSAILEMLKSDDFETYYKVFSMKKYCGEFRPKNIQTIELAQTSWFKSQIEKIILTQ